MALHPWDVDTKQGPGRYVCFGVGDFVWRFQGSSDQQPDTGVYFLWLLSVIEKSDVKEDSIDTGCVLHYKVNPYVNSHTDGLTCCVAEDEVSGGRVEKLKIIAACLVTTSSELGQKPDNCGGKKKRKKKSKNVSCSDVIRKAKAEL